LRNKEKDLYDLVTEIHDKYTSEESLCMLKHPFHSQKNEVMNKSFTTTAPKSVVCSCSHLLFDQLAFVVAYNSVGFDSALFQILRMLLENDDYQLSPVMSAWAKDQDAQREKTREKRIQ